jgi:polo-like kinase 1
MVVGRPPFETSEVKKTYIRIKKGNYSFPENISLSHDFKDLINKIFILDPSKRIKLD